MLFNSIEYLIFLPIVLCFYWISHHKIQNRLLLVASYIFYGLWDIRFLFLIILSTSIDYMMGILIDKNQLSKIQFLKSTGYIFFSAIVCLLISWPPPSELFLSNQDYLNRLSINDNNFDIILALFTTWILSTYFIINFLHRFSQENRKKIYVGISIFANLLILGFFKYYNFFIDNAENVITYLGGNPQLFHLNIILPVGISFYTFQTMSYSLDVYRGKIKSTKHFLDFALFVAYFPQLVAGPIERASNLLPRILNKRKVNYEQIFRGIFLIFWGFFKKIAIADGVAGSVNSVYNTTGVVSSLDVVLATMLFAIQIYCDFSAYSDIARGTSKLLGIELMRNFNLPYFSTNPSEFWRRWHISLSSWLRDYLYIPLGGNKKGNIITYRNLGITMLLGGLWHGAAWNYILWGAYQGAILSIHRYFTHKKEEYQSSNINLILKIIFFFIITCYGWLLFRANSFTQITEFTYLLFNWNDLSINIKRPTLAAILALPMLIAYEFFEYKTKNIKFYCELLNPLVSTAVALAILFIAMGLSNKPSQFIYFQF